MSLTSWKGRRGSLSVSSSLCPYTNLAFEKELLESLEDKDLHLFLYRNNPCIVMGRFQVPWREIDLVKASSLNLRLVRRRSGGGTVYHDPGNWNFCFLRGDRELHREDNLDMVIEILKNLGIETHRNERFDLTYHLEGEEGIEVKKISGSAFKQQKDRSYHHATLLVDANLKRLKGTLGTREGILVEGKGIASHPSPVINLKDIFEEFSFENWIEEWKRLFQCSEEETTLDEAEVSFEKEVLSGWDWLWGETPENRVVFEENGLWLLNKKGVVLDASTELKTLVGLSLKQQNCEKVESLIAPLEGLSEKSVKILTNLLTSEV